VNLYSFSLRQKKKPQNFCGESFAYQDVHVSVTTYGALSLINTAVSVSDSYCGQHSETRFMWKVNMSSTSNSHTPTQVCNSQPETHFLLLALKSSMLYSETEPRLCFAVLSWSSPFGNSVRSRVSTRLNIKSSRWEEEGPYSLKHFCYLK